MWHWLNNWSERIKDAIAEDWRNGFSGSETFGKCVVHSKLEGKRHT